jgi:DNA polymerase III delta prime subunit
MAIKKLWVEEYRPSTFDEYIFQNPEQKKQFVQMIENKEIPHLLLSGSAGTGKTSMSKMLVKMLDVDPMDILLINASKNNSVEYIRDSICSFATTFALGNFKVVQLEESDMLTLNAQTVLKDLLEETQDTCRFIFTCNHENKIIPPIKSRLQHFHFKASPIEDITLRVGEILVTESVEFDMALLEKYVVTYYPDIRKIINALQQNTVNGQLTNPNSTEDDSADYQFKLLDLIEAGDMRAMRKLICENVQREEYDGVYRFLYENIHKAKQFKNTDAYETAIVTLASYLYKNSICADPEINFAACAIELGKI